MAVGTFFSPTPHSTLQETEMRPRAVSKARKVFPPRGARGKTFLQLNLNYLNLLSS